MKIVAIDWAVKKPITVYDGSSVFEVEKIEDIKADIVLSETGIPRGIIARMTNVKKILLVPGEEVKKYRDKHKLKKDDYIDPVIIYKLYQEHPELFTELKERNRLFEYIRYYHRKFYELQKIRVAINNRISALRREYLIDDDEFKDILKMVEQKEKFYEKKLIEAAKRYSPILFNILKSYKGISDSLAAQFIANIPENSLERRKSILTYCGFHGNYKKSSRKAKTIVWKIVDQFIRHRVEPYRSVYDRYKEKKRSEGMKGRHLENICRRKVAQRFLCDLKNKYKENLKFEKRLSSLVKSH